MHPTATAVEFSLQVNGYSGKTFGRNRTILGSLFVIHWLFPNVGEIKNRIAKQSEDRRNGAEAFGVGAEGFAIGFQLSLQALASMEASF
jgi:hypothetical protein